jgi:hypothetical protein
MTTNYDMREAIDRVLQDTRADIHTSMPGRVLAYDAASQTVDVRPALMREGVTEDGGDAYDALPDIFAVPIQWPRAGGFAITFPIAVGDWVHLHFAEQSTLAWRFRGVAPCTPGISDPHGLNSASATPGYYPDREKLTSVSTSAMELRSVNGAIKIVIEPSLVTLGGTVAADFVALDAKVRAAIAAAIVGHTHAVSGAATTAGVLGPPVLSTAATKVRAV